MQTVAVRLNARDVAQGFKFLDHNEKIDFLDELYNAYRDDAQELSGDITVMATEAKGYSNRAKAAINLIRDALNIAAIPARKTERQSF